MKNPMHFGLIGEHVDYTRSPDVFQAIFAHLKVSGQFEVHSVPRRELQSRLRQLVLDGVRGFSITIPHKEAVLESVDDLGPVAQAVGAINSVCVAGAGLYGYNTDRYGFSLPLRRHRHFVKGRTACILGCGGAARAVVYALYKDFDVRQFVLVNRTAERAEELARLFGGCLEKAVFAIKPFDRSVTKVMREAAIVVNCTPLGGPQCERQPAADPGRDPGRVKVYYDLNYNQQNPTLARFADIGVHTLDGSSMLVGQALRSFDIWTGISVDFEPIYESVFGAR